MVITLKVTDLFHHYRAAVDEMRAGQYVRRL